MNTPRKPLWPKIVATVVVFLPLLYAASYGPACCLVGRGSGFLEIYWFYKPLLIATSNPGFVRDCMDWYAGLWDEPGRDVLRVFYILGY
jgi:hypothetical protein